MGNFNKTQQLKDIFDNHRKQDIEDVDLKARTMNRR